VNNNSYWTSHGDDDNLKVGVASSSQSMSYDYDHNDHNHMENMLHVTFQANEMNTSSSHEVNPKAFYTMLESAQRPLYEGYNITKLETSVRLLSIKLGHNMSQCCFNEVVGLMKTHALLKVAFQKIMISS